MAIIESDSAVVDLPAPCVHFGLHNDLAAFCLYLHEDSIDEEDNINKPVSHNEEIYAISKLAQRMLEDDKQSERLSAAKEIASRRPDCALAWVVLAREGTQSEDEAEVYYRKAVKLLEHEHARHALILNNDQEQSANLEPYILEEEAYPLIVGDLARLIWRRGRQEEAVNIILSFLKEHADPDERLMYLASSWLIQLGKDEQALSLLRQESSDLGPWYYSNALLIFRAQGNNPTSRAALEKAITEDLPIARLLMDVDSEQPHLSHHCDNAHTHDFVDDIQKSWQQSEGAIEWLRLIFQQAQLYAEVHDLKVGAIENIESLDKSRFKLWQDNYELAVVFMERNNLKEAKRLARFALREAEKLGIGSQPFEKTLNILLVLFEETNESPEDILRALEKQRACLTQQRSKTSKKLAVSCAYVANHYICLQEYVLAEESLKDAMNILEKLLAEGDPYVSLYDFSRVLTNLALSLGEQKRYAEAESCLRRKLELEEQFLGQEHPDLIDTLDGILRCVHHLGRHEEEASLRARIALLDGRSDYYDSMANLDPDSPWHLSPCPGQAESSPGITPANIQAEDIS